MNLDSAYQDRRQRLTDVIRRAAVKTWTSREWGDNEVTIRALVRLANGSSLQIVALLNAYFWQKAKLASGRDFPPPVIDPALYTISLLRGIPAEEVYSRPFGLLGSLMRGGTDFIAADKATSTYTSKLIATDLQLAQVKSANDWMSRLDPNIPGISGYKRIWEGGCEHCRVASLKLYRVGDLMPIHENCGCGISPVFAGEDDSTPYHESGIGDADSELGNRLDQSIPLTTAPSAG